MDETIIGNLCANCKWEVVAEWDDIYEIYRCSDCGSEVCEEAKSFEELKENEITKHIERAGVERSRANTGEQDA